MKRDIGVEVSADLSQKKENKERIRKIVLNWFETLRERRPHFIDELVDGFEARIV